MPRHRRKRMALERGDHRVDIGPAGRNIFISRDKQLQSRQAKRIKVLMRLVMVLVGLVVAVGVGLFVALYMVPYFQAEISLDSSSSAQGGGLSSLSQVEMPTYDSMGLPVYDGRRGPVSSSTRTTPRDASYVPNTVEAEGVQVEAHIASALQMLVEAAREDGLALTFSAGYVSYEEQERLFEEKVQQLQNEEGLTTVMARTQARLEVPMAGESDMQSGMCLRVEADPETFGDSRTCSWLRNNMGKYGFVFRYPRRQGGLHRLHRGFDRHPLCGQRPRHLHAAAFHVFGGVHQLPQPPGVKNF